MDPLNSTENTLRMLIEHGKHLRRRYGATSLTFLDFQKRGTFFNALHIVYTT
jgi:hypothetical protein